MQLLPSVALVSMSICAMTDYEKRETKNRPKAVLLSFIKVKADVLGRGPFNVLLDDYSILVISHTGYNKDSTKTIFRKNLSVPMQWGHLRNNLSPVISQSPYKQGLGRGGFTSIAEDLITETDFFCLRVWICKVSPV